MYKIMASHDRNTPTCVGKTRVFPRLLSTDKKHPHVRGEDGKNHAAPKRGMETPPRAWGRRDPLCVGVPKIRNTPTCVGKTGKSQERFFMGKKHPHVRGEDYRLRRAA